MKILLFIYITFQFAIFSEAKIIYVEPVRNAKYVNIGNNIIIGLDEVIKSPELNIKLKVTGSVSGIHTGELIITADKKKLIFKPHLTFEYNETVEVKLSGLKTSKNQNNSLKYTFQTQIKKDEQTENNFSEDEYNNITDHNFTGGTQYGNLPPPLTVTILNNPSPGHILLNNFKVPDYSTAYILIANNDGSYFYTRELTQNGPDFKRQPNGLFTYYNSESNIFYAEDSQFNIVDSFYCVNGFTTNSQDLKVLNNGHALLMSYDRQPMDMSQIVPGGHPNATVTGLIIQEIDENKNVVFQWRSWDHYSITDAYRVNLTFQFVDYCHGNAIEPDSDGNILISARHLNEITKINRSTGDIIWRMGGANNQFTFVNDTVPFIYQHDIRRIANGNVTLYDNGNFRTPVPYSRAVEYHLDEVNKIATKVWEYRNNPDIISPSRGSVQRLKNGNTLIGWGSSNYGTVSPSITEVTPSGEIALEMFSPLYVISYRAFKDEFDITLNLKLAIESIYDSQTDQLKMKDTVRVFLRNSTLPYAIVDTAKSFVDSACQGIFTFSNVSNGIPYYIELVHRNSIDTWSKTVLQFLSFTLSYDFTTAKTQAYGDNMIQINTSPLRYGIYSGDVDQDGTVDISDVTLIDNDAFNFVSGYVPSDVNGDEIVDVADAVFADNNRFNFVSKITP